MYGWDAASKIIFITLHTDFSCDNNNNVNKKMKMMFWSQFAWMRWGLQVGSSSATRGMSSVAVVGDAFDHDYHDDDDFDHNYDYEYDWNADDFDFDDDDWDKHVTKSGLIPQWLVALSVVDPWQVKQYRMTSSSSSSPLSLSSLSSSSYSSSSPHATMYR